MFRQKFEANDLFNIVSVACISQRRNVLFTANPLQAWALREGATVPRVSFAKPTRCMCLSTDERTIAVASGSAVSVIDVDSATEIRTLAGHVGNINTITAFNKNVYCWATGGEDGQCILWNIAAHPPHVLRIRVQTAITALALSPDDRFCVVGTDVGLEIYDLRQRAAKVKHIPGISVHGVSFHPREFLLSSFGGDRMVRFWDLETFECIGVSDEVDSEIKNVSFAPNGDLLIACTDESLHLVTWEPVTEVARSELPPQAKVVSVQPTAESLDILCAFADRSIGLFNTTYEEILASEINELAVEDVDPFEDVLGEVKAPSTPLTDPGSDGAEGVITPISEGCSPDEEHQPTPIGIKDGNVEPVHRAVSTSRLQDTSPPTKPLCSKRADTLAKRAASRSTSSLISLEMSVKSSPNQRADTPEDPNPIAKPQNRTASVKKSLPLPDMRPRNASTGKLTEKKTNTIPRADRSVSVSDRKTQPPPSGKEITRTNSTKSRANNKQQPESMSEVLNAITSSHPDAMRKIEDNKRDFSSLTDLIRRRGLLQAFDLLDGNKRELALLISVLSNEGSAWTLALASKVLPRLRLLSSGGASPSTSQLNRSIIAKALSQIVSQVGGRIKECANGTSRIGVDVAAEERQQQAQKCLQALMELRINGSFLSDKLPSAERKTFESTLKAIDDLCKE